VDDYIVLIRFILFLNSIGDMASLFLFTGEYGYGLRAELKRWREKFITTYGAHNYTVIRADDFAVGSAIEAIVGGGLFAEKKLIVIYGIPGDTDTTNKILASKLEQFDQQFQQIIPLIPETTTVVFVSNKPDKRMKAYKTYT
jgi:DNA polymerase III delta subunit